VTFVLEDDVRDLPFNILKTFIKTVHGICMAVDHAHDVDLCHLKLMKALKHGVHERVFFKGDFGSLCGQRCGRNACERHAPHAEEKYKVKDIQSYHKELHDEQE